MAFDLLQYEPALDEVSRAVLEMLMKEVSVQRLRQPACLGRCWRTNGCRTLRADLSNSVREKVEEDDVYAILSETYQDWILNERRVTKFVKRVKSQNPTNSTSTVPLTLSTGRDSTLSPNAAAANEERRIIIIPRNDLIDKQRYEPTYAETKSLRRFIGMKKFSSDRSAKSTSSSSKWSVGSMRSFLSIFRRRRKTRNDKQNNDTGSLRSQESPRFDRSLTSHNNNRNPKTQTTLDIVEGGLSPSQTYQPVSHVPIEESIAIQAAIEAVLRHEQCRQLYLDKMEELSEEEDDELSFEEEDGDNRDEEGPDYDEDAYIDDNEYWREKETCCCHWS